jgi:hypothetical protein
MMWSLQSALVATWLLPLSLLYLLCCSRALVPLLRRLLTPWEGPIEHSRREPSRAGAIKSFVDFFALTLCDEALLTNWSLFGRAAVEVSSKMLDDDEKRHLINDSKCGILGHKPCLEPRVPHACPALLAPGGRDRDEL